VSDGGNLRETFGVIALYTEGEEKARGSFLASLLLVLA